MAVRGENDRRVAREAAGRGGSSSNAGPSSADDMCDDIQREIDERWAFLAEMQAASRGDQYKGQMRTEISQRVAGLCKLNAVQLTHP
jgi:hypothetical protein